MFVILNQLSNPKMWETKDNTMIVLRKNVPETESLVKNRV
jgi:hypothetical protein